ncbi:unnamed protein product [Ceratitis capitata]|uniref:(Mediterranean fruit fly) hypothetical protein n=1 Tax=Ceratitis capitata TaxID=7213 RepID=A0A811UQ20_CERCA|nr:unnamed protein product [Ceratitis capitata]
MHRLFLMFSTIIDKDTDLTAVERMQYLESSLRGSSLDTIRLLEIMQDCPRLPELNLPDPDLTAVERMQYLESSLRGASLDTIRLLEISSSNYIVALDLLEKRRLFIGSKTQRTFQQG